MELPVGTIIAFGGKENLPPTGWAICNGEPVSKNDLLYKALYDVIKTTWGGDGNPNFNLPDLHGMFLRGTETIDLPGTGGGTISHNHNGHTGNAAGDAYGIRDGGDNPPAATGFNTTHSINPDDHIPPFKWVVYLIKL